MGDVTGPIATLPGSKHKVPKGMMCDDCSNPAKYRIQGETDSFGAEMIDLCDQCYMVYQAQLAREAEELCTCDWCNATIYKKSGVYARDFDEGMYGPVYFVCLLCGKRNNTVHS